MKFDPEKHQRRSIRLKEYDYTQEGAYFVTVCVQKREFLLGKIVDGETKLNDIGQMVDYWWLELVKKFPTIETDEYVVMPNHFHGIVIIVGADRRVCPPVMADRHVCPNKTGGHIGPPLQGPSLSKILQWFKTMTTNAYLDNIKKYNWPFIDGKLWQRNYYEHIIRNEKSLNKIREYIATNPLRWHLDQNNPQCTGIDEFDRWLESFRKSKKNVGA